jgi:hypothetical protein
VRVARDVHAYLAMVATNNVIVFARLDEVRVGAANDNIVSAGGVYVVIACIFIS